MKLEGIVPALASETTRSDAAEWRGQITNEERVHPDGTSPNRSSYAFSALGATRIDNA